MVSPALDRHGWLKPAPGLVHAPSPNFDPRPSGCAPYLLVIHNISLPPGEFGGREVIDFFQNQLDYSSHPWLEQLQGLKVSAHFFIRRDGTVVQFVSTEHRAWHAGVSCFEERERCNDFSIGIELEGTDSLPYSDHQYACLKKLTRALQNRYALRAVRGHEHIAPERKTDPGPSFDWNRYRHDCGWFRRQLPPVA